MGQAPTRSPDKQTVVEEGEEGEREGRKKKSPGSSQSCN